MINFTRLTAASVLSMLLIGGMDLSAANHIAGFDIRNYAYKGKLHKEQKGFRIENAGDFKIPEVTAETMIASEPGYPMPDLSLPASHLIGDLDAPDGSVWFYTADYKYDYEELSEYYKRPVMREYEFKIYDGDLNLVGTIKDKVRYKDGEVAVPSADLAPFVTRHFFNSDDNYEIVVGLYVNTDIYVNNEYSIIYSIGGDKEDGYDVPLMVRNDTVGDVLNASEDGEEKFYVTFMTDDNLEVAEKDPDNTDPDDPDKFGYWEMLTSYGMRIATYSKADESGNLVKVWEKRIRLADLPGDQSDAPFLFSFMKDGKPYFLYSQYEDTFFNPYYDFIEETTMRENNHLVVELYLAGKDTFSLERCTKIPMHLNNQEDDRVLCSYYSIGSFRYRDDVIFRERSDSPEFIVTVQDYSKENDENYNLSFFTYNADGSLKNTIFRNAVSHSTLADLEGFDPSEVFINTNIMGGYDFHVINLVTTEEELSFSNNFEINPGDDPDLITSNIDRVSVDGSYKYAIEMRSPGQDENGDDLMRIMWIDRNGKFERFDEVPMGNGVYFATVLIESKSLNPTLYDPDEEYEYLMLVKRGYPGNLVKEELLVAKPLSDAYPEGKVILMLEPEERGSLQNIAPYTYAENPVMLITYYDDSTDMLCGDFYKLPFTSLNVSVDELPVSEEGSEIIFDGKCLKATGRISLYNVQGAKVAEATGELDTLTLPGGIYVARSGGNSLKIFVK